MIFFGFQSYQNQGLNFGPFNTYAEYSSSDVWLSYATNQSTDMIINYYTNLLIMQYV